MSKVDTYFPLKKEKVQVNKIIFEHKDITPDSEEIQKLLRIKL